MTTNKTTTNVSQNTNNSQNIKTNKMNFANAVINNTFPKKEQGIIILPVEGIEPEEYVYSVGDIIGPQNITHTSRKNKKIYIFLSKKEHADYMINNHKQITINNKTIEIRRLINPAQRLIISNVCPTIPHDIIVQALINQNIKLVSPITFLHSGLQKEEYKQILGFRRQVFYTEDNDVIIPPRMEIEHDDVTYQIYLTTDTTCTTCKVKGHAANNCPNQMTVETLASTQDNNIISTAEKINQDKDTNNLEIKKTNISDPTLNKPSITEIGEQSNHLKRPATTLNTQDDDSTSNNGDSIRTDLEQNMNTDETNPEQEWTKKNNKRKNKKQRSISPKNLSIEEQLRPLQKKFSQIKINTTLPTKK